MNIRLFSNRTNAKPSMKQHTILSLFAAGIGILLTTGSVLSGECPATPIDGQYHEPTYGVAVVDGFTNEWNLTADLFTNTFVAGDPTKAALGKVYLRYDCSNGVMYVLILNVDNNYPALVSDLDAWAEVAGVAGKVYTGASGNDGTPPDFSWIGIGFDGNPNHALGYEASFPLAPGQQLIEVHVEADLGTSTATSGTPG